MYLLFFSLLLLHTLFCTAFIKQQRLENVPACSPVIILRSSPQTIEENEATTRYRARIAYDGAGYKGFQIQPRRNTIQGELEKVLSQRFQRSVRVLGAGRTDTGVHARGQAIHFDLEKGLISSQEELGKLEYSLNRMLKPDIRLYNLQQAPIVTKMWNGEERKVQWSAMYDSIGKLYTYRISVGKSMNPIERHNRYDLWWSNTNLKDLERILKHFEGEHDFRAFAASMEQLEKALGGEFNTIRTVHSVNLIEEGEQRYRIDLHLSGALYKMVRNMVGTALDVACGRLSEEDFLALLNRSNNAVRKTNKSKPAPPQGLTLEKVYYDDY
mmetsp:Transcript_33364/g.36915  ORF Transcript_33364/g.36915 Transcript_33364/m.36915 type:complete len:327 (-) Transcript_33364:27-1007(-)